jgi:hypothetical protein
MKKMEIMEENPYTTNSIYQEEKHRCLKCGKKLTSFIAYIPLRGEACMDCYIEAAEEDEENRSL